MEVVSLSPNRYMALISISILVYEYAITINQEVERFWVTRKLNLASFLFYVNRYLTLFGHIPVIFEYFWIAWFPEKGIICNQLQLFHQVLAIAIQAVASSWLMMRIYALYDRNRYVLALLMVIPVIGIVAVCWTLITGKSDNNPLNYVGCEIPLNHTVSIHKKHIIHPRSLISNIGDAALWGFVLVFDTLIIVMTICKTLRSNRLTRANLTTLILRDGFMYYLAIMATNLATILTLLLSKVPPANRGFMAPFANVMSSVLISRQMFNLRDPELRQNTHEI